MVTKTAKRFNHFSLLLMALSLILGLAATGCSNDDDYNAHIDYQFEWAGETAKAESSAVSLEAKLYDKNKNQVGSEVEESSISKMKKENGKRIARINTQKEATKLVIIFKDKDDKQVGDTETYAISFSSKDTITIEEGPIDGAPTVAFYPADATAETIAKGDAKAIETIEVEEGKDVSFTVFSFVGNSTEAESYQQLNRDAKTVTVSGLDNNEFVTLADSAWKLTGVAETEKAQTLTVNYNDGEMEEDATATLAITVTGAVVGVPSIAIYPADATAETIAKGDAKAIETIDIVVGTPDEVTVFICTGNANEPGSYTAVAPDDLEVTVTLEDNPYVVLDVEAGTWILKGDKVTTEAQTMTISYKNDEMTEAATAALDINVVPAPEPNEP